MQNLVKPASQSLLVERQRWDWMIKVFAGACLSMSIRLLHPCFIKEEEEEEEEEISFSKQ